LKRKLLLVLTGVVITLTLAFSPVSAKPQATLPGGVGAGPQFHWRWQSGVTASNTSYWLSEELVNLLMLTSGGRLYIDLLPTGSLCNSYETLDATMTGSVEMAGS
jgi:TRAP-type mannitol/chloroaromatic compound transport system substrate-binding protein